MIDLGVEPIYLKNLDQIDFGIWDGKTEKEMEELSPTLFEVNYCLYKYDYPFFF
jgi:broad specificity phosphatase PhoE